MDYHLIWQKIKNVIVLACTLVLFYSHLVAQSDTNTYRQTHFPYILRVQAGFPGQSPFPGFGFVVRIDDAYLYLATAAHVISPKSLGLASEVMVRQYKQTGWEKAQVVQYDLSIDLALLRIPKPADLDWYALYRYANTAVGEQVYILGINDQWEIPSQSNSGKVLSITPQEIEVAFSRATGGSSGGPVFTQKAIIGMLLSDEAYTGTNNKIHVLPASLIMRKTAEWLPASVANKTIFPFINLAAGPTLSAIPRSLNRLSQEKPSGWGIGGMMEIAWSKAFSTRFQFTQRRLLAKKNEIPFKNGIRDLSASLVYYPTLSNVAPGGGIGLFMGVNKFWYDPQVQIDGSEWTPLRQIPSVNYQIPASGSGLHFGITAGYYGKTVSLHTNLSFIWTNAYYLNKDLPQYLDPDTRKDYLIVFDMFLGLSTRKYRKGGYDLSFK